MLKKRDFLELKRRMKKETCTFTRMAGCYVDIYKNKVLKFNENFLNLEDDTFFKYLDIAKKTLTGTVGNNLLALEFDEKQQEKKKYLLGLRDSSLKNEELLEHLYDMIIDNFNYSGIW